MWELCYFDSNDKPVHKKNNTVITLKQEANSNLKQIWVVIIMVANAIQKTS